MTKTRTCKLAMLGETRVKTLGVVKTVIFFFEEKVFELVHNSTRQTVILSVGKKIQLR